MDDKRKCDECGEDLDYIPVDECLCTECHKEVDEEQDSQRQLCADYQASVL
jgi:hypothetical protein